METIEKFSIKDIPTQRLLNIRQYFRATSCWCGDPGCEVGGCDAPTTWGNETYQSFTKEELYAELALRPHIPNGNDRKARRIAKAKQRNNSNRGRRNRC